LKTDLNLGLKQSDVEGRLRQYGYNEIPEKKVNSITLFVKKFWGLTAWMLEAMMALAFILGKYSDLYTAAALLMLNSFLGFIQEQRSSKALEIDFTRASYKLM